MKAVERAGGRTGGGEKGGLTFSGAAPKLKGREKWIGWSPRQQARRLGLVCNNSRFLLLVEHERHPNLASKILSLALRSVRIAEKSNEIPAIKPLLTNMNLQGRTVTADAMHCQQETARFITQDLGGDYIFGLKGNQSGILDRAELKLGTVFFPSGK